MYFTERSSPFDPGARPSNSSDARTLMCARRPSGVIASSAGCKRSLSSSLPRSAAAPQKNNPSNNPEIFMLVHSGASHSPQISLINCERRASHRNVNVAEVRIRESTEATGDVVFGLFFTGVSEDFHRWPELDEFAQVKERREIGNAARLLHVVSHNHNRVLHFKSLDQFLDLCRGN